MTTTFASLGTPPELVAALSAAGITQPFPIQSLTIADALAGRDVCGKAKTGSGKTLAYGIPLLARTQPGLPNRPRGLVLVPTRELALQVSDVLEPLGASVGKVVMSIYGGAKMERQIAQLTKGADVVVADLFNPHEVDRPEKQVHHGPEVADPGRPAGVARTEHDGGDPTECDEGEKDLAHR